jgi:hypothetical protein
MNKRLLVAIVSAATFTSYFLTWVGGPFVVSPNALIDLHSGKSTLPEFCVLLSYFMLIVMGILTPFKELPPKLIVGFGLFPFVMMIIGALRLQSVSEGMITLSGALDVLAQAPIGVGLVLYFAGFTAITVLGFLMLREKATASTGVQPLAS